jgi:hypothetical protein
MSATSKLFSLSTLGLAATLAFAVASGDALARDRSTTRTTTAANGNTVTHTANVSASGGTRTATRSAQGSGGHGVTSSVSRTYNPSTGTVNRDVTVTGDNGKSVSHDSTVTH